jgi:phage FluMu gp28-like protein
MSELEKVITFTSYQKKWRRDHARFKAGMFARQTGKTFTTSSEIVDDCVLSMIAKKRARWVILSRGERQAKEALDEAIKPITRAYYEIYNVLKRNWEPPREEEGVFRVQGDTRDLDADYKTFELLYPGGSRITAVPASPDTARGFSANVFFDEFAFHANSKKIWSAAFPILSKTGLKARVTSTPNGKGNKFYEIMTGDDPIWSRHTVDIYQAVEGGLERNIDELRRGLNDEDSWAQEYELKFLDDAGVVLPMEWVTACEHPDAGKPELYQGGLCVAGNDIAARGDLWVFWVFEIVGDVLVCRQLTVKRRISFAEQDAIVAEAMNRFRIVRLGVDQTGMGEKPVEDMKRAYGDQLVEGVLFGPAVKLDLANGARRRFEERRIRIPAGDDELRADLTKTKRLIGPSGTARLLTERDAGGHADRFWALCLAVGGASGDQWEAGYTAVNTHGRDRYIGAAPAGGRLTMEASSQEDELQEFLTGLRRGKYH